MAEKNYAYYPKLWQKAYLIEIVNRNNGELLKSYAFSLPPESVSIEVPQRVNITKTFGGAFVDDYGTDLVQINLSGTTGNTAIREVYIDGVPIEMNGKGEAYHLLNEILQYKNNQSDYAQQEMRLYDLSSVPPTGIFDPNNIQALNIDSWVVVLKEGKISRSKDRPLFFSYSLQFVGISPLGIKRTSAKKTMMNIRYEVAGSVFSEEFGTGAEEYLDPKDPASAIKGNLDKVKTEISFLKKAFSAYQNVLTSLSVAEQWTNNVEAKARSYYKVAQGYLSSAVGAINTVFDIAAFPYDLARDLVGAATNVRDTIEGIIPLVKEQWNDIGTKYASIGDMLNSLYRVEEAINDTVAQSKKPGALEKIIIVPSGTPGAISVIVADNPSMSAEIAILPTFGDYVYNATSGTRLDSLSKKVYGTPDYADTIAVYNGINGDSEITPGMELRIPYLSYTQALQENEVYDSSGSVYGTDIALDGLGDLVLAEYNDYATVSGTENIVQAIDLRLSERDDSRVRLDAYGIKMDGGGYDSFSIAVLLTSIKETLLQDPRIQSVYNITGRIDSDKLVLGFAVKLEAGGQANFTISL